MPDPRLGQRVVAVVEVGPDLAGTAAAAEVGRIKAVTVMAMSWFTAAVHMDLVEGRSSLAECFDEVVAACRRAIVESPLGIA